MNKQGSESSALGPQARYQGAAALVRREHRRSVTFAPSETGDDSSDIEMASDNDPDYGLDEENAGRSRASGTEYGDKDGPGLGDYIMDDLHGATDAIDNFDEQNRRSNDAPRYSIPQRRVTAVELPAIVMNLDRAIRAFDALRDKSSLLDKKTHTIPLYLNPESPWRQPIMSHGARTHNVVLKITVPKRTGRRRKKGGCGSWEGELEMTETDASEDQIYSRSRLDDPRLLRRKLADNVGKYQVNVIGTIKTTHRFRGLSDFYWNLESSPFVQKFMDTVFTNDVEKMKNFSFVQGTDKGPNIDIVPPPIFTPMALPFNYAYAQNPHVQQVGEDDAVNITLPTLISHLISADEPAPAGPKAQPDMTVPRVVEIIAELEEAFEERPIWTRRALMNHIGRVLPTWNEARKYTSFISYQFKGGPWRDAIVKFGIDPRTDPKYRIYQTLMFQAGRDFRKAPGEGTWPEARKGRGSMPRQSDHEQAMSHVFDGKQYFTDGKVWQVCDITDPLLASMLSEADVRPTLSPLSGWYHGGIWVKVKGIMKTKLMGIMFKRELKDTDFARCLATGNLTPPKGTFLLSMPNLRLTDDEWFAMTGKRAGARRRHRASMQTRSSAASTKALEWLAAGGGIPTRENEPLVGKEDEIGRGADQDMNIDPRMADISDHDQVEELVNVGDDDYIQEEEEEEDDQNEYGSDGHYFEDNMYQKYGAEG